MVTGFSLSNGSSTPATTIGNPMSRNWKKEHRQQPRNRQILGLLCSAVFFVLAVLICLRVSSEDREGEDSTTLRRNWEEGPPTLSSSNGRRLERGKEIRYNEKESRAEADSPGGETARRGGGVRTASSIDAVVQYLDRLAQLPPSRLWDLLGMERDDRGDDPFSLRELDDGRCPWTSAAVHHETEVKWLPPRPYNSEALARRYRANMKSLKGRKVKPRRQMERYDAENEVALWYEHISKAGGTTFCGLVKSNMLLWQVPRYHCMPRKGELMDGRVGSWPNDELADYLADNRHAIVSNEWDAFSLEKLELSGRRLDGARPVGGSDGQPAGPWLLFLTTLRDTQDRLLSAYTFFGLTTVKKGRSKDSNDDPTFDQWIDNMLRRAGRYEAGSKRAFRSNVARMNHIVWRFSGGELSLSRRQWPKRDVWERPFETAVRALTQHDLILPMDVMTKEQGKAALSQLLGWDRFDAKGKQISGDRDGGHVVTQGEIKNSNAREHFRKEDYKVLW
eukprot:CAMPEP_0172535758 /NCGR_PEP_ID=MMETSP1067-20121228/7615_1 /TAXON_ID=265564 ORGANISM="Thalassiosira punctigera, Strain Tpunct2005C2" /NCGR_SAMPLE_ID=MMETSP1067 /ASSEMBLY_ACC=CAM_ASM_000444 /LENGTH=505 /DNA_ID=CAMNT_0013320703 /DNA_START=90 /DNA_END=1604 /DNA_ORIENTATION=+